MNMFMGWSQQGWFSAPFFWYHKFSDIREPGPSKAWVFVDVHEDSIHGGNFFVAPPIEGYIGSDSGWLSLPASRHSSRATISFADGHVEIHKWIDARTRKPVDKLWWNGKVFPNNPDVTWLVERSTAKR